MKKLFLASYFTEVANLLPKFVGGDLAGKRVVFIPTAALPEKDAFYVDTDRASLQKLGLAVEELEISTASPETIKTIISNTDYIFVGGGNTFFLLQELKRKGVDKLIIEHIEKGKLYVSTSAGSALVQKDIVVDDGDNPALAPDLNGDFTALSIIDFYLYMHYGHNYWGNDDECIDKYYSKLELKRISDKQAVTIDGEKVKIVTAPCVNIQAICAEYREAVNKILAEEWNCPPCISRGRAIDTTLLPGFVSLSENKINGVITYSIENSECEIVTLNSLEDNKGIGTALIDSVVAIAKENNCRRVWLVTSNDMTGAIRFYQRKSFDWVAVHFNAMEVSRKLKPSIPLLGVDNIPLKHDLEFEFLL